MSSSKSHKSASDSTTPDAAPAKSTKPAKPAKPRELDPRFCEACKGHGQVGGVTCAACDGTGFKAAA